jgi:hypothetical protein
MLRILNQGNHDGTWSLKRHLKFVKKCEEYIHTLEKAGKLIAAQPLARQGIILSKHGGIWMEAPLEITGEIQVGYYHIRAEDYNQAIAIAKENPEFQFGETAKIEIRPVEEHEDSTGFIYPTQPFPLR